MKPSSVEPEGWPRPSGYSNGMLMPKEGRLLLVAGQVAFGVDGGLKHRDDFLAQFKQALKNVLSVVEAAGGKAEHIGRLTIYVTDKREYLEDLRSVGATYRDVIGKHFPAMALVQVADLLEEGAKVEIEATAIVPESP